jgi:hypothetical protein
MRTADAGVVGKGTPVAEFTTNEVTVLVIAAERVGKALKVVDPVGSVAVGFRLREPLRFCEGSLAQTTPLRRKTTHRGIA